MKVKVFMMVVFLCLLSGIRPCYSGGVFGKPADGEQKQTIAPNPRINAPHSQITAPPTVPRSSVPPTSSLPRREVDSSRLPTTNRRQMVSSITINTTAVTTVQQERIQDFFDSARSSNLTGEITGLTQKKDENPGNAPSLLVATPPSQQTQDRRELEEGANSQGEKAEALPPVLEPLISVPTEKDLSAHKGPLSLASSDETKEFIIPHTLSIIKDAGKGCNSVMVQNVFNLFIYKNQSCATHPDVFECAQRQPFQTRERFNKALEALMGYIKDYGNTYGRSQEAATLNSALKTYLQDIDHAYVKMGFEQKQKKAMLLITIPGGQVLFMKVPGS